MLHSVRLTISGEWVECWCGCGWKYNPSEADGGTRLGRLRQAQRFGREHVKREVGKVNLQRAIDRTVELQPTVLEGLEAEDRQAFYIVEAGARRTLNPELIDIVFDGPPDHVTGRFVEVENQDGASISIGEWIHRDDGYWVLRLPLGDRHVESTD